jgi:DNA processing protein
VTQTCCIISELPCDCRGRRWGQLASERIVVELAALAIVVEADESPEDLAAARMAQALGRTVAAIPGRITSPLSRGSHALLIDGADLIRGAADALELLYRIGAPAPDVCAVREAYAGLEPKLTRTLERVGAGSDTPAELSGAGMSAGEVLLALSELELMGLLSRGDGGRYVLCHPLPRAVPDA